jgi:hypothetical protein
MREFAALTTKADVQEVGVEFIQIYKPHLSSLIFKREDYKNYE